MKYPASHLTPFLAPHPQNFRVLMPLCSSLPTDRPERKPSVFASPLFSMTSELPPTIHRFASPAFSSTSELLFSHLPSFQKHLRCPLVFFKSGKIRSPLSTFNCRLSTAIARAIVSPS